MYIHAELLNYNIGAREYSDPNFYGWVYISDGTHDIGLGT